LLGTLEIRTWSRAVISRGFGAQAAGLGGVFTRGLFACGVLTRFASAFAAVTAVAVTRAAFAALTVFGCAGAFGRGVAVCCLVCCQSWFSRAGICGIAWAALRTLATVTSAFSGAFTPAFAATITAFAWRTLCAHFAAIGIQLRLGIAAAFAQAVGALAFGQVVTAWARAAITTAFTGRAITVGALAALTAFTALRAFTAFGTFTAWGTGFAFTAFDSAFTTASALAWRADFACCAFAAFAPASIATTTAAITARLTA
jgi:hypothetical protein